MFLLICKLYICIQNVFGHIFYRSQLHLYWQFWQFEVQKLAYMLILAAGGVIPYLSSVGGGVQPARISAAALNIDPASFSDSPSGHKYRTPLTSYSLWRQMVKVLFVYQIYFLPGQI